ncbi:MAG: hypothetical protein GXO74_11435 [Calditrichaeota bacterium]|nr:hypothetical protein [Calditrichota bacterium]
MARILWIEDEAKDQLIEYVAPLLRAGHFVELVGDASEAYQRLNEARFDVIIFDLLIGIGDDFVADTDYPGLDLLIKLFRDDSKAPRIDKNRVIVFTVVTNPNIIDEIKNLGIQNIKTKQQMHRTMLMRFVEEVLAKNSHGEIYESK